MNINGKMIVSLFLLFSRADCCGLSSTARQLLRSMVPRCF